MHLCIPNNWSIYNAIYIWKKIQNFLFEAINFNGIRLESNIIWMKAGVSYMYKRWWALESTLYSITYDADPLLLLFS